MADGTVGPRYWIVESQDRDVRELVKVMRDADVAEITAAGFTVKKALWRSYRRSIYCRTAFVDGEIACMWGVGGTLLGAGEAWLLTGPGVEKLPLAFVKEGKREIARMRRMFATLVISVHADYTAALRLVHLWGFGGDQRVGDMILLEIE